MFTLKFKKLKGIEVTYKARSYENPKEFENWTFELVGFCNVSGGLFENMHPYQFAKHDTYGGFSYNTNCDLIKGIPNFIFSIKDFPINKYTTETDKIRYLTFEGTEQAKQVFYYLLSDLNIISEIGIFDVEEGHPAKNFMEFLFDNGIETTPPCFLVLGQFSNEFYGEYEHYSDFNPKWIFNN